jgi:hypothetical protein
VGYYFLTDRNGVQSGLTAKCDASCNGCQNNAKSCLNCSVGFVAKGDKCLNQNNITVKMVIKGGTGASSIFT